MREFVKRIIRRNQNDTKPSKVETVLFDNSRHNINNLPLEALYERTHIDVRNQRNPTAAYIKLMEVRDMIPEIDDSSQSQV